MCCSYRSAGKDIHSVGVFIHSSCLVFLMAALQERISALEAEIEGYRAKLDAATTEAGEERYANLITESKKTLNLLLQQQQ